MKSIIVASMALVAVAASASIASAAASREDFRGRWSRDCGNGQTCHLDIDDTKSRKTVEITFSIEGHGETCTWSVDAVHDKGFGGPVAHDPYGNYYFYLTIQNDGRLYSSGTMVQNCGPQPLDQHYIADPALGRSMDGAATSVDDPDNRSVFDHNGSTMAIDPSAGTIVYRNPKKSISGTVSSGTVLFKAISPWDPYDDKARHSLRFCSATRTTSTTIEKQLQLCSKTRCPSTRMGATLSPCWRSPRTPMRHDQSIPGSSMRVGSC
ncbi:hypothetical protein AB3G45_12480 [Shinella sp. S4-D37]|uniref:hypothetical protein n=1 Tax=Shinella sp. S4-D37 TaxID=3161999 RepID=UPI003467BEF1